MKSVLTAADAIEDIDVLRVVNCTECTDGFRCKTSKSSTWREQDQTMTSYNGSFKYDESIVHAEGGLYVYVVTHMFARAEEEE